MHRTLVDPATLADHLEDDSWVIVDCRFDLADPAAGERLYLASHVPGARYAHLDRDLSGETTGANGRHPLPAPDQMRARFGALGIDPGAQVVAYDADSGMYAARLWWMLRYLGHEAAAVLDGGFARWSREGRPVRSGPETWAPAVFAGSPRDDWRVDVDEVQKGLDDPGRLLVDARAEPRFRGDTETLDRAAGHIPGAVSYFFQRNLTEDRTFLTPGALRAQWHERLAGTAPANAVMYCGSGVTACHNLLALEVAGLPGARLYPGSWSEWSADPARPGEKGDERPRPPTSGNEPSSKTP